MSGYVLHPEAYTDLDDLWEYIAEDSLGAAGRVQAELYGAIRKLASFPKLGHRRVDLTARPIRFIGVRDYLIAYAQPNAKTAATLGAGGIVSAGDNQEDFLVLICLFP